METTVYPMLTLLFITLLRPVSTHAYFRLTAQTIPYLVMPRTRPELRSSAAGKTSSAQENEILQKIRSDVLALVNKERQARKLQPLKQNVKLDRSAQGHAEDMLKRKFFSHQTPEGKTPEQRIDAAGYFAEPCKCPFVFSYGENIAKGQQTPADVMKAWMASKVHRDNILKTNYQELGVGFAGGMWVQNFGEVRIGK